MSRQFLALLAFLLVLPSAALAHPDQDELVIRELAAQAAPTVKAAQATPSNAAERSDEMTLTLKPSEGAEVKVEMRKGDVARFTWSVTGGVVNYDTHGESFAAPDKTHSYAKGRGVASDSGDLVAAFDGKHGWFWRNRGNTDVTVTVRVTGTYTNFKRVM